MSKVALPRILKTEEIGESLQKINKSFSILDNVLNEQKTSLDEITRFKESINLLAKDLRFSYNFMKRRNPIYKETWEDILNKRNDFIKPIITVYPEKIRDDIPSFSSTYIENLIHDWITKTYIIQSKSIQKPNYVEGQKAIVYYLKSTEEVKRIMNAKDSSSITCVTENVNVTVNCVSRAAGRVCIGGCGCVNCAAESHCSKSATLGCRFTDGNVAGQSKLRYLQSNTSLIFEEYPESRFDFVKFIVEDCIWKVNKS